MAETNESVTLFTKSMAMINEYDGSLQRMYQLAGRNIYRSVWVIKLKSCVLLWKLPQKHLSRTHVNLEDEKAYGIALAG